jgi:predicted dithiol-disulfide oxidoreductase (DUF899 family)
VESFSSQEETMATVTESKLHSVRFPGESEAYRAARNELLEAEMALRKNVEAVAALRRKLPLGGEVSEDYVFEEDRGADGVRQVRLSELFEEGKEGKDTLAVYSFMYGPSMKAACPMCTSMLDSLNGGARHISERINLVVVAKSPMARIREFADERGWGNLRLLSSAGNTYNRDYRGESPEGNQTPSLNIFVRRDGAIHHFYNTELLFAPRDPGQDGRHVDMLWPLWNMLDFTPEGRGERWYPKLSYS